MKKLTLPCLLSMLLISAVSCVNLDLDLSRYEMERTLLPGLDVVFEQDTIKMTVGEILGEQPYSYNISIAKNSQISFTLPLPIFTEFGTETDNLIIYGTVYNDLPFQFDVETSIDGSEGFFATQAGPVLASLTGNPRQQDFEIHFDLKNPISQIAYLYVNMQGTMMRDEVFKFPGDTGELKILLRGAKIKKNIDVNINFK